MRLCSRHRRSSSPRDGFIDALQQRLAEAERELAEAKKQWEGWTTTAHAWSREKQAKIDELKEELRSSENERANCAIAFEEELASLRAEKDGAYEERNRLVALLCSVFPSVRTRTAIEGWEPEWHNCVFLKLPTGQASWHYHDSHAYLFAHVPEGAATWDGHTTPQKYERVGDASMLDNSVSRLREDAARLDWLDAQSAGYGGWIARESTTGRGYRLHEHSGPGTSKTAREAIDAARAARAGEGK